ncbi:30S ribosomal protein S11 [Candidatus Berkelbacteria bacterium CG_4_9_14_3_um_filter_39_23]|uniref:Small ribosomal subunit protein uS11 n=2 Tax=Candidatus Berkelbacteria TaxID=1618330 RepID=A0A2M7CIH4_9BACT|nr:30S ribosomal protein S11 [Candidatus Berkelbacteria bacterium]OIP06166.1 MAG: 30S ribosomal protein S11 [Candidatus Berkelbacteria bacterium CG2_30_39_44]PIR28111.1 MAG: 30S ribosomal protein S11 [Candidatus Berkelbacteria bacterium CG11_big_fil_rev_8_21_14_0_20_40_23]PIV25452.1 MAG: 30S ribosomal protein S11 [Candidatus Berkelbacteria bacterium CG03_land_8_20_14_0_80_40_36]PIX30427.1 MAG: 30S ribosomal protein S11 [Candidatus Berkelbacteria bacterium CG_4_8_14_3_um_filter_39_27]PIZ28907.1
MAKVKFKKKKQPIVVSKVNFYIHSTFNNTIITATDENGNTLAWATAGGAGFKGAKKATPFAASQAMKNVIQKLPIDSIKSANIFIKGVGTGRDAAARALAPTNISIIKIQDKTPLPHNGTRAKKPRKI